MPKPVASHLYTEVFGAPVQFGASRNALVLHSSALLLRMETGDMHRYQQLCHDLRSNMLATDESKVWEDALQAWIVRAMEEGITVSQEVACADFGVTPRTMQRRLKDLGLNFLAMRARTRMQHARRLLSDTKLSVTDIAQHLGFSETSAFTRAFRSDSSMSPNAFRKL